MEQQVRTVAGGPRLLLRALFVCCCAALWLLLGDATAEAADRPQAPGPAVDAPVPEPARDAASTVRRGVADGEEAGRRAGDEAVRTVKAVARQTAEAVDETTEQVQAVLEESSGELADTVEPLEPVLTPPVPEPSPRSDRRDGERPAPALDADRPLVTQENPALLAVAPVPASEAVDTPSVVVEAPPSDSLPLLLSAQLPTPPYAPVAPPATPGGAGISLVWPLPAADQVVGVLIGDLDPSPGVLSRALTPPADRASSPGTTPD